MTTMPRPGTRATAIWSALLALVLALAGPLGATTRDVTATDTRGPVAPVAAAQHLVAVPAVDAVVTTSNDCPAHGAQHEAEALGVLCLSAPLGNTGTMAVLPGSTYRDEPPALAAGGSQWMRARALAHTAGHDPVLRGISRT